MTLYCKKTNIAKEIWGEGHRLLTAHSKTERGERGQLRQEFNDRDFLNSARNIIPQQNKYVNDFKAKWLIL
ncbi:hypothetical protein [Helicobacter canadensis]|nr:hypothetical protein [Helicobacter canadensis]